MTHALTTAAVESNQLPAASYQALAQFRHQVRCFFAVSEALLSAGGLPPAQYQAMLAIKVRPCELHYTVSDLARDLFIKLNTAVELVDRLERAEWVARTRDPRDRRRTLISLTSTGLTLLERFARCHLDEHRRLLPDLAETVERLDAVLNKTESGAESCSLFAVDATCPPFDPASFS